MSSIAYVSDERMLEYHRMSGNAAMNFWRLSLKNFERFTVGDLLFFIDKRNPHPVTKEKGVIGYGRASQMRTMSVQRMWNQFEEKNGYPDYMSFKDAIVGYGNEESLPKQIQSIYLEDVAFFKAPVYMSEIDSMISKRLESFTYLSVEQSIQLIKRGRDIGLDPWTQMMNPQDYNTKKIIEEQIIRNTLESININWTHTQEKTINQVGHLVRVGMMGYYFNDQETKIVIPVSSIKNQFYELVGVITYLREELKDLNINYVLVIRGTFEGYETVLSNLNVALECI